MSEERPVTMPDAKWRASFRRNLLAWYEKSARDLPWRRTSDPYAIWVSEIMLQQTVVATVESYFPRFLDQFPTIRALASSEEDDVLRVWEGLGYYRRARQMRKAAQVIVERHGGVFPQTLNEVQDLPGIGRYTAGAVLSIAFDARTPILEANTIRLFSRLLAYGEDPRKAAGQRILWEFAELILPRKHVGRFNQSLMELGSQTCRPKEPDCAACPAGRICRARGEGLVDDIPMKAERQELTPLHEAAALVQEQGRWLVLRYADKGRWAGLWDFPRITFSLPLGSNEEASSKGRSKTVRLSREKQNESLRLFQELIGRRITLGAHRKRIRHGVTRYAITLDCFDGELDSGNGDDDLFKHKSDTVAEIRWVTKTELADLPLSSTGRKLYELLD